MPLTLERPAATPRGVRDLRERRLRKGSIRDRGQRLTLGLVNNMPDGALDATQRQFARVIDDSAGDIDVRLKLYALTTVPRGAEAKAAIAASYHPVSALRGATDDALIVTGAEPKAARLIDEPYWRELTALFDLARARTCSTLYSCLAAHAAVLAADGVGRVPLPRKLSGVYKAKVVAVHSLVADFPASVSTPHSRLNGLDEDALDEKGYVTLTRSPRVGADMFIKDVGSLQVFLQGHPEYDADTLAREFRRDLGRYVRGERETAPELPEAYFPEPIRAELEALVAEARIDRRPERVERFPVAALASATDAAWRDHARRLYRNWLTLVAARKAKVQPVFAIARWGG